MENEIAADAARLVRRLRKDKLTITFAESCTGGLLASTMTDIAGASEWFKQSWVTYANEAKVKELNVSPKALEKHGAVSAIVAIQMAQGALKKAGSDVAISVTGIAGPSNDGSEKPIGTVHVGIASGKWKITQTTVIGGSRHENKLGFVHFAINTAMREWDAMLEYQEQRRLEKQEAEAMKIVEETKREAERKARLANPDTEWQDQDWQERPDQAECIEESTDTIGDDVAWE